MKVTFKRTGERRYRIEVEGPGVISSFMEPAAGYDAELPHDLAHFVVEKYLNLRGAVFGRLAAGGHQFQPLDGERLKGKKGIDHITAEQRAEADLAERVIDIACRRWKNEPYSGPPAQGVTDLDIAAICGEYDAVSRIWSGLQIGDTMTLDWNTNHKKNAKRARG